jgi:hypothetical protein
MKGPLGGPRRKELTYVECGVRQFAVAVRVPPLSAFVQLRKPRNNSRDLAQQLAAFAKFAEYKETCLGLQAKWNCQKLATKFHKIFESLQLRWAVPLQAGSWSRGAGGSPAPPLILHLTKRPLRASQFQVSVLYPSNPS